jgi:hypothetical protein
MLTKKQRKNRPLPTLAELEEVEALGGRFHDALENISIQVEAVDEAWNVESIEPETFPTHEQIGELFLFAYYMDGRATEIRDHAKRIMGALPGLGTIAADVELWRAAQKVGDDA